MISENSRKLMEILISSAEEYVKNNSAIATRGITAHMLENANVILNKMKAAAVAEDINSFNSLLVKLYRIIPRITNKSFFEYEKERAFERLNEEQIFIDAVTKTREQKLSSTSTAPTSSEESFLLNNGLEVHDITAEEKSFILNMMGSFRNSFINAWKVCNIKGEEAFQAYKKKRNISSTTMLWHGSPTENFLSIFSNGLDIAHARYGMFGPGVYFAPKFGKSRGYTSTGYWKHGKSNYGILGIFEVATGKTFDPGVRTIGGIPSSYDSLWAHSKSGFLLNDEVVVYNDNASSIRYLVQAR